MNKWAQDCLKNYSLKNHMYKQDMTFENPQWLIYHKIQPTNLWCVVQELALIFLGRMVRRPKLENCVSAPTDYLTLDFSICQLADIVARIMSSQTLWQFLLRRCQTAGMDAIPLHVAWTKNRPIRSYYRRNYFDVVMEIFLQWYNLI